MHANLDETVFYPAVLKVNPSLVGHAEQEHQEARQLINQLKGMQAANAEYDQLMAQLQDAVMQHVQNEEQSLFPKIQQAGMDMNQLGIKMQAYDMK